MELDGEAYSNKHRALLQHFLASGALTLQAAKPVIAAILSAEEGREILAGDVTETEFNSQISVINSAISLYDLEIRSGFTQYGQSTSYGSDQEAEPGRLRVFALVNTISDAVSQMSTTRTADELAYMGRVLDDMFDKNNKENGKEIMAIAHNQAVRLNKGDARRQSQRGADLSNGGESLAQTQSTAQGLTMKQAETTLKSLVEEGWLEVTGSGRNPYYMLSPRALMELKGWLVDTYNEPGDPNAPSDEDEEDDGAPGRRSIEKIKLCAACNDIVISGQRCGDKRCRARLHDACTGAMWRSQRGAADCPKCKRPWSGHGFVGVRAEGVTSNGNGRRDSGRGANDTRAAPVAGQSFGTTSTAGRTSVTRSNSRRGSEIETDDEEMDED